MKDNRTEAVQTIGMKSVRAMTAFLRRHGCEPIKGHYGQHYHFHSGFFRSPQGQIWYWMSGDDRYQIGRGSTNLLVRTATDTADFHGGLNNFPQTGAQFDYLLEHDPRLAQYRNIA